VFNHDGSKLICVQYPSSESWQNFIFEVPTLAGGLSRKIWDKAVFSWLSDLAPDGSALLEGYGAAIRELDLVSGAATLLFADDSNLGNGHFSHDGRWVAFTSAPKTEFVSKNAKSRVYVAPFRKTLVPRSEWIQVISNTLDSQASAAVLEGFDPRFSENDKLIFFESDHDGFSCIWAQRLRADMRPDGDPFAVYHSHERKLPLSRAHGAGLAVGPRTLLFERMQLTGNIWLLEQEKAGPK